MANNYEINGSDAHSMTISLMQAAQVSNMIPRNAHRAYDSMNHSLPNLSFDSEINRTID